jgi:predicted O-methyltransferase YrrM
VYSSFQLARKYIHYYRNALNSKGHGMHSPFVFQFILDVLNNRQKMIAPRELEQLRKALFADKRLLTIEDMGAGSRVAASKERTVRQLAATAVKPKKYSQLFYRLVKNYQPKTIIELGTSLGLTTAFLASAYPAATVYTIEGSTAIREVACHNFEQLSLTNIQSLQGNFDQVLPVLLQKIPSVDLAYIDGNHRYQPTLDYFHQLLQKAHNNTILVFDDIHWSAEMEQAWNEIKQHPSVRCTVDIFFLGFVFFRSEFRTRQDFTIRF